MDQICPDEYVEVGGAAEGAAALCGGGESHGAKHRTCRRCRKVCVAATPFQFVSGSFDEFDQFW
jgi:hypothetical protein